MFVFFCICVIVDETNVVVGSDGLPDWFRTWNNSGTAINAVHRKKAKHLGRVWRR